jgi:hypothetical protein
MDSFFFQNIINNSILNIGNLKYNGYNITYSQIQFVNGYQIFTAYIMKGNSIFEISALNNITNSDYNETKYLIAKMGYIIEESKFHS